jgi:hypothetical protein
MANTYDLISSNTLLSSATSVTFSGIPSTYRDLVLKMSCRSDQAAYTEVITLRFNGSSATTYSYISVDANGTNTEAVSGSSETYVRVGPTAGSVNTANTFGNCEVYIPVYQGGQNKPVGSNGVSENQSTTAGQNWVAQNAGYWRNTAAITSIQILPIGGPNWVTGSSFYLYGIKNT